ncbi:hypothetical protein F444_19543 [Phytophthora nicotianae P1976]|uniref:Uncharacterized protein n=2 Tax=Phytophthora nicotianae TaxID=4792 RepID=A0A080Z7E6_PHYNI|nr:hypothetical protein F444_19543 [Phytophthora nicotianae P1976]
MALVNRLNIGIQPVNDGGLLDTDALAAADTSPEMQADSTMDSSESIEDGLAIATNSNTDMLNGFRTESSVNMRT